MPERTPGLTVLVSLSALVVFSAVQAQDVLQVVDVTGQTVGTLLDSQFVVVDVGDGLLTTVTVANCGRSGFRMWSGNGPRVRFASSDCSGQGYFRSEGGFLTSVGFLVSLGCFTTDLALCSCAGQTADHNTIYVPDLDGPTMSFTAHSALLQNSSECFPETQNIVDGIPVREGFDPSVFTGPFSVGRQGGGMMMLDASTFTSPSNEAFGGVQVGNRGTGVLEITNGGTVDIIRDSGLVDPGPSGVVTGFFDTGIGTVNLRNGSSISVTGGTEWVAIGKSGQGTLNVLGGSSLTLENLDSLGYGTIGSDPGAGVPPAVGSLLVSGVGSMVDTGEILACAKRISDSLTLVDFERIPANLIEGGTGSMIVRDGGVIRAAEIVIGPDCVASGDGTLDGNVTLEGTLLPGNSPGTITIINGNLTLAEGGTIKMEIDGTGAGQFDAVKVDGDVILNGGTIEIEMDESLEPEAISSVMLVEAVGGDISGTVELVVNDSEPETLTVEDSATLVPLVPCEGPPGTTEPWKNHGKYVSAVAHAASDLFDRGLISAATKGAIVSEATGSSCGSEN